MFQNISEQSSAQ